MEIIKIEVSGNYALSPDAEIVCGNSEYFIEFVFSKEWEAHTIKTARFIFGNTTVDTVFDGNTVQVPVVRGASVLEVGVFAGNLHTTTPALIGCRKSILCKGGTPQEPATDVYAQILALLTAINKGGTSVTIEGEAQETFPADMYIAERLAELVNSAPATLDTLAEIATALGNDPNFATTIIAQIGKKLDKTTEKQRLYATNGLGEQSLVPYDVAILPWLLVQRESAGEIRTGQAHREYHAVPLGQLNEMLAAQVGDIAAALDEVHAYAQALVTGGNTQ